MSSASGSTSAARDDANIKGNDDEVEDDVSGLELDDLNPESLFTALTAVEMAIPHLLQSVKPILSHLSSSSSSPSVTSAGGGAGADEESGILARASMERYMSLVDKIQFVLRQTVYYLRETGISNNTLNPPSINSIPAPFASSLPSPLPLPQIRDQVDIHTDTDIGGEGEGEGGAVELGLYASRIEVETLKEFQKALKALLAEREAVHPPLV